MYYINSIFYPYCFSVSETRRGRYEFDCFFVAFRVVAALLFYSRGFSFDLIKLLVGGEFIC